MIETERKVARGGEQSNAHVVVVMLIVAFGVLALPFLILRKLDARTPASAPTAAGVTQEELAHGGKVYHRACAGCHEPKGEGRPGRYPSLVGASWLLEDKETPIRITLLGVSGPMEVGGELYNGVMPNLGVTLSDEDIANVLTYARSSWGNSAPAITKDEVAKVRASLGDRVEPWAGGAALIEARSTPVLP